MKRSPTFLFSTTAITAIVLTLMLSGCGQSGPLYIPGDPSQMAIPPSETPDAEEEEEESDPSAES